MYNIEVTDYGMKHTFRGVLDAKEMKQWYEESKRLLSSFGKQFNMVMDMRDAKPLGHQAEEIFYEGTKLLGKYGLRRGAVIMENPEVTRQMRQIARYANVQHKERYIDAVTTRNWEKLSRDWAAEGIDPDRI